MTRPGASNDCEGGTTYDKFPGRVDASGFAKQRMFLEQTGTLKNFVGDALRGFRIIQCDVLTQCDEIIDGIFLPLYCILELSVPDRCPSFATTA